MRLATIFSNYYQDNVVLAEGKENRHKYIYIYISYEKIVDTEEPMQCWRKRINWHYANSRLIIKLCNQDSVVVSKDRKIGNGTE